MIRLLLLAILFLMVYHAIRILVHSAIGAYKRPEERRDIPGEEMVLDPQCRIYIVKGRSVTRRINGTVSHFCSPDCADRYEQRHR